MYLHYFESSDNPQLNCAIVADSEDKCEAFQKAFPHHTIDSIDDFLCDYYEIKIGMMMRGWGHDACGISITGELCDN